MMIQKAQTKFHLIVRCAACGFLLTYAGEHWKTDTTMGTVVLVVLALAGLWMSWVMPIRGEL
jgi:hypothetical protein